MTSAARQITIGVGAALRTPLWLRGQRFRQLMEESVFRGAPPAPQSALRAARGVLRILGRVPLLPWRNTCLYRSVAECLVLRHCGVPCRLRIGVRRGAAASTAVEAHAWVEWSGRPSADSSHAVLHPSA